MATWAFGPAGGAGVTVTLTGVIVRRDETLLTFSVTGGARNDILLYEPPKPEQPRLNSFGQPITENFEELYLVVNGNTKLLSTTGFEGGSQSSFNGYNLVRQITIPAGESLVLTVRFPPLPSDATTLKFVSPGLNGWQSEWYWMNISLNVPVLMEQEPISTTDTTATDTTAPYEEPSETSTDTSATSSTTST